MYVGYVEVVVMGLCEQFDDLFEVQFGGVYYLVGLVFFEQCLWNQ